MSLEGEIRVKKQELKTDAGRGDVSKNRMKSTTYQTA